MRRKRKKEGGRERNKEKERGKKINIPLGVS